MMAETGVRFDEEDYFNERGMRLNTSRWLPSPDKAIKGLVFLCHGWGMECSIYTRETGQKLASGGYAVYGIDYEGHGKSEGLQGYVPSMDNLVTDCDTFFSNVMDRKENRGKSTFLLGESAGGMVSILISRRDPSRWTGLVLVAPLLKIPANVKPPWFVVSMLSKLSALIPTWKIVPAGDFVEKSYKDPTKLDQIRSNPYAYKGNHRLRTSVELLQSSIFVEAHLAEVSLPFLCVQGSEDAINDPAASQELYDSAVSTDKTLKLYPGMWHGLTTGEPDENVELVFEDITKWLDNHAELKAV
ncbi:unnamed protein product [Calypogeia fissa]